MTKVTTIEQAKQYSLMKWREILMKLYGLLKLVYEDCGFCLLHKVNNDPMVVDIYDCKNCEVGDLCGDFVTRCPDDNNSIPDRLIQAIRKTKELIEKLEKVG